MAIIPLQEPVYRGNSGPAFFAAGFRPFFLSAALQAAVMVPLWLVMFYSGKSFGFTFNPILWHGHEMVFGFGAAAVGGFLLTAVPNWTGTHHVSGRPLMVLFGLWLAGRVAMLAAGVLPGVVAAVALAYLPVLAFLVARPLIQAGKWRNIAFLPILGLLWIAEALVVVEVAGGYAGGMMGIYLGIFLLLLMIAIVGGRIVPSFTQNWLRMQGRPVEVEPVRWIETAGAAASVLLSAALTIHFPGTVLAGGVLLATAALHAVRLWRWHGVKVLSNPLLWVLHLGYLWLVVGMALLGLSQMVPGLPASAAVHALTAGSIGTMVIGVMSRAALGHSGRPLELSPVTVAAYGLVSLGATLRVLGPVVGVDALTHAGGLAWTLGWLGFVVVYWPIVTRPRADGRPG